MLMNLPMLLTVLRVVAIPFVVLAFYWPEPWGRPLAAVLFSLAAITDWLDGWLARRWNQTSALGAFLDPVADKLIVATALVVLLSRDPTISLAILTAIIIGREITISALREWMAELGARTSVAVSWVGKVKTTFQMAAIIGMLWHVPLFGIPVYSIGYGLLFAAAALTMWSMFIYLRAAWPLLSRHGPNKA
ncbi:CDP-diacylglycerol--glycerol-3-phosphate 3-phosphatidyltransferase [bacterium]|nr:CDP-diacylglycerol--glycerol-3-phosphate 3-phosphatidyltransferase [bacterium]